MLEKMYSLQHHTVRILGKFVRPFSNLGVTVAKRLPNSTRRNCTEYALAYCYHSIVRSSKTIRIPTDENKMRPLCRAVAHLHEDHKRPHSFPSFFMLCWGLRDCLPLPHYFSHSLLLPSERLLSQGETPSSVVHISETRASFKLLLVNVYLNYWS